MREPIFLIARDARGSLVHVRNRKTGDCASCIEVGLCEIVPMLILAERREEETNDDGA